jgi:negative regulator of sigma E activity
MKPINENDLEQVSAFIDGELSDSERRFFQKRLCNDAELREYCERAWIASSVLKSQPFQLMPSNSADQICAKCEAPNTPFKISLRLVASFGALALVAGLGLQLLKPSEPLNIAIEDSSSSAPISAVIASGNSIAVADKPTEISDDSKPVKVDATSTSKKASLQFASQDSPAQFELNEATRSKSWPTSNQGMDEYLIRHNQMIGSNANNGLISYAQILTEPTEVPAKQAGQASNQDSK